MKYDIIPNSVEILTTREEILLGLRRVEINGRRCYQSEMRDDGTIPFIKRLIGKHHESVLEHCSISVAFTTTRDVSHQLVRHRLASFSQESQRYCSYCKGAETDTLFVALPQELYLEKPEESMTSYELNAVLKEHFKATMNAYQNILYLTGKAEVARSVLPNYTKTNIGVTANLRQWRHIFRERCARAAQPEIRALMNALISGLKEWSWLFEDIEQSTHGIHVPVETPSVPSLEGVAHSCKDFYNCNFTPKKEEK